MSKKIKLTIGILTSLLLLLGGTYAAWEFITEKTEIKVLIDGDQITYTAGENIEVEGMMPVRTPEEGIAKEIEIYKESGDYTAGLDLYLKLTTWPTELASNSFRWALYKNGNYLSSGTFLGTKQGNDVKLTPYVQKINQVENIDKYKLYIWIDASTESNANMMNKSFIINLYGRTAFYDGDVPQAEESTPNAPELVDGMIPVRYNYKINEWEKADSTNIDDNWYDYYNKKWANAVLVTSESRDRYMTATEGTTIDEKDILAYYVWIPRYKYLLFNVNSEASDPREIQIVFEKETDPISNGDENGEYLSHPAFWWDNNSDNIRAEDGSEELAGIWIGKFETSGAIGSPKILPNVASSTNITIKNLFNMNKGVQSLAYLTETGVNNSDAHMMKNTEWGSAAYLSHSRYGINKEITINNNSNYITGRQGNYTYNDFLVNNNIISTTKVPGTGVLASATGNVYGIYDMSGCGNEYVMGLRKNSSSSAPCYNDSGFTASTMPELKYYNLYEYVSSTSDFTKRILGDATGETAGWYNDQKEFIYSAECWFVRGLYSTGGKGAGAFSFRHNNGNKTSTNTSRGVILTP